MKIPWLNLHSFISTQGNRETIAIELVEVPDLVGNLLFGFEHDDSRSASRFSHVPDGRNAINLLSERLETCNQILLGGARLHNDSVTPMQ
ncbi:hypothetical protein HSEST_3071 (plasmid) [Halapricum desulfuricans]|uniref:Uncharacterized protein n=1 Tax=Halapricum desulfuricans TaxID=2841257 RepID=A0A897NXN0_9EURY|nr:hypothetical protein HSEST_3071 [Halapricum desulfuricans]